VFHTASPFFNSSKLTRDEFLQPAINGTLHVLEKCSQVPTITKVILTSSTAAIVAAALPPKVGHVYSEADWSDVQKLEEGKFWYPLSKTLAEQAAWKFVDDCKPRFELFVLNPCLVVGPMLQPTLNESSEVILKYASGENKTIPNASMMFVDVRFVQWSFSVTR
jgi:nucleoside-diphosphate-sugar epimerase